MCVQFILVALQLNIEPLNPIIIKSMANNRYKKQESITSGVSTNKSMTTSAPTRKAADASLPESQVQGGRSDTSTDTSKEMKNAAFTQRAIKAVQGGKSSDSSSSSERKTRKAPSRSKVSASAPSKKQSSTTSASTSPKPKRPKTLSESEKLFRWEMNRPERKASHELAQRKGEYMAQLRGDDPGYSRRFVDLADLQYQSTVATRANQDVPAIAAKYGIDPSMLYDINGDGVLNELDAQLIVNDLQMRQGGRDRPQSQAQQPQQQPTMDGGQF